MSVVLVSVLLTACQADSVQIAPEPDYVPEDVREVAAPLACQTEPVQAEPVPDNATEDVQESATPLPPPHRIGEATTISSSTWLSLAVRADGTVVSTPITQASQRTDFGQNEVGD